MTARILRPAALASYIHRAAAPLAILLAVAHTPSAPAQPTSQPSAIRTPPTPASQPHTLDRGPQAREARVRRYGGNAQTEGAVEAGLAWLAAHQRPDGTWSRTAHTQQCPQNDRCAGIAIRRLEFDLDPGVTALVLLAFLGGGYTHADGPYAQHVDRAVAALLRMQLPSGDFSADPGQAGYNNSVATFALAEHHALTGDPRVVDALRRGVARLVQTQQELGGWDYLPDAQTGRNDTSITAWAVQALHAAASAGIEVPPDALVRAALHFARSTDPDGRVRYADGGTGTNLNDDLQLDYRFGPAMTAAALTCELLLGWRVDSPVCRQQQALLRAQPPDAGLSRGGDTSQLHGEYYWYYGTIAMFQAGGDGWPAWNGRLRDVLLPQQDRARGKQKKHSFGSWAPFASGWGRWARSGGRVYSTAINVLTLEIYYRHAPAYLEHPPIVTAEHWRAFLRTAPARDRLQAVETLPQMLLEIGEPALLALLADPEPSVAIEAAIALTAIDSPRGRALLAARTPGGAPLAEQPAERALRRAVQIENLPPATGHVRLVDAARGMATVQLSRAFVGMELSVLAGDREVARLRVIQRFSGRDVVVAEFASPPGSPPPTEGAVVRSR